MRSVRRLASPIASVILVTPPGQPLFAVYWLYWILTHRDAPNWWTMAFTPPYRLIGGLFNFIGLLQGLNDMLPRK
jgi:hypothetical protein